jgi:hypothetical protein
MKIILLLLASTLLIRPIHSQGQRNAFIKDSLDNYIEKNLKDWQIPGLSVCIVKVTVVLMKGDGMKNWGQ